MKKSIVFAYLQARWKLLVGYLLVLAIFFGVYALYHLPLGIFFYAALLADVLLVCAACCDWIRYQKKHRMLQDQLRTLEAGLQNLPIPEDQLEEDYQALLLQLFEDKNAQILSSERVLGEMNDYYTLWAHQIKTPLTAIRLLLQSGHALPQQREMEQQVFEVERYVEMVLQYLRLQSLSNDLALEPCDLGDLVRQAVKKYAVLFIYRKLSVELGELDQTVLSDQKWLAFVIEQVLSNALKYTEKGAVKLYLDAAKPTTLVVEDTGIGIRPEDIPRIFERGFTGANGHLDHRSTGIGLYLCKTILDQLGHTIQVESTVGQGTKVSIGLARDQLELI